MTGSRDEPRSVAFQVDTTRAHVDLALPEDAVRVGHGTHRLNLLSRRKFEIEIDYPLRSKSDDSHYRIETYFFIPRQLKIDRETYSQARFYRDLVAQVRLKPPALPVTPDGKTGPLDRAESGLDELVDQPGDETASRVNWELRYFACRLRVFLDERVEPLGERIKELRGELGRSGDHEDEIATGCEEIAACVSRETGRFRKLGPRARHLRVRERVNETYSWIDEHVSLLAESRLTQLVDYLDREPQRTPRLEQVRDSMTRIVCAEQQHRRKAGYATVVDAELKDERVGYRIQVLETFASSILELELSRQEDRRRWSDLATTLAAGLSVPLAAVVAAWSRQNYGANSMIFAATVFALYVFRDRIKDFLKQYFTRQMTRWLPDYKLTLRDRVTKAKLGRFREAMSFIRRDQIPEAVWKLRQGDKSEVEIESKPEAVIKYGKQLRLYRDRLRKRLCDVDQVTDVMQFDVSELLQHTVQPRQPIRHYDGNDDRVVQLALPRVNHLNLVIVLRNEKDPPAISRVRAIFDARGIQRLEGV